jgi:hypothetical protein
MSHHLAALSCWVFFLVFALHPSTAAAQAARDGAIFRWDGRQWTQVEGAGIRISVGPDGTPWVVNAANQIFRWANGRFQQLPGAAKDIGVGGNGAAWIVGIDDDVYRWNQRSWERVEGSGVAIAVERAGTPWVVDAAGRIYLWLHTRFILQPGTARDIGAESDVWIVSTDNSVHRLTVSGWSRVPGAAVRISSGAPGAPWVVTEAGEIFRWEKGAFQRMPGQAQDIAVSASGDAWITGGAAAAPPTRSGRRARPR